MRVLFVGGYLGNTGPENVNKNLIKVFDEDISYVHSGNKVIKYLELLKICNVDCVVVSGLSKLAVYAIKLAKIFKMKTAYLMHGCVEYESGINGFHNAAVAISQEHYIMQSCDLILGVSSKFAKWLIKEYPQFESKISYINNGNEITEIKYEDQRRVSRRIVAIGGDRKTKNNEPVSRAVSKLDKEAEFVIFGKINFPESISCNERTRYMGQVSQDELHNEMARSQLFVLNSVFESFSLAAIEALQCGCSILLSDISGVTSILELDDTDIIYNPEDVDEIAEKIEYLLEHPNRDRIYSRINWAELSYENRVQELKSKLQNLT